MTVKHIDHHLWNVTNRVQKELFFLSGLNQKLNGGFFSGKGGGGELEGKRKAKREE